MSTFKIIDYRTMSMREIFFVSGFTFKDFYFEINDKDVDAYIGNDGEICESISRDPDRTFYSVREDCSEIYIFRIEKS